MTLDEFALLVAIVVFCIVTYRGIKSGVDNGDN